MMIGVLIEWAGNVLHSIKILSRASFLLYHAYQILRISTVSFCPVCYGQFWKMCNGWNCSKMLGRLIFMLSLPARFWWWPSRLLETSAAAALLGSWLTCDLLDSSSLLRKIPKSKNAHNQSGFVAQNARKRTWTARNERWDRDDDEGMEFAAFILSW